VQTEKSGTLGTGNDQTIFAAIPINDKATRWQGGGESRNHDGSGNGLGIGKEGDPSPTLTAGDRHGVMCGNQVPLTYGIGNGQSHEAGIMTEEVSQTLNTMHDAQAILYQPKSAMEENWAASETKNALRAGESKVSHAVVCEDVSHTIRAKANCAYREDAETYPVSNMVVRRLTPMECERLQGFPDGWTDIGDWVKADKRGREIKVKGSADSPRYKALGNSIALPFWDWMLRRMARYLPEDATLGSLFDGIGGFPLIFERIHGKGTARWASEIEPFPIAVTKKWFGEE
jgi:DNA (cytosine-5)-methyltransferase 1